MILTHICPVVSSILINWMSPFPILGVSGVLFHFFFIFVIEIDVSKQWRPLSDAAQSAVSDLGLHCLPMSLYGMLGTNTHTKNMQIRLHVCKSDQQVV